MSQRFNFFDNAGLTTPGTAISGTCNTNGTVTFEGVRYWGALDAGYVAEAASDPGVDDLEVYFEDATPGSGAAITDMRLATTLGGLDTATPGAPIVIGPDLDSGAANAVAIYYRCTGVGEAGVHTDLSLQLTPWHERVA